MLRALIWQKKVIKLIKVCETDFQIRAPESKKHTFISTFLLKFSNTPSREQKTHYQINFFGENLVNEFVDQDNDKIYLFPSQELRLVERNSIIKWIS